MAVTWQRLVFATELHVAATLGAGNHAGLALSGQELTLTASANPGAAARILASDASGYLRLTRLGVAMAPVNPLDVTGNAGISGGLNVGTATGATAGDIKASGALHLGADCFIARYGADILYTLDSFRFLTGYTTYTEDGVWHANARYGGWGTPSSEGRFGYHDGGSGQYYPSIGFLAGSANYLGTLLTLQNRIGGDSVNVWQVSHSGILAWGPGGAAAVDTNLYRSAADILKTDDSLTVAGGLNVGTATGAGTGEVFASGQILLNNTQSFRFKNAAGGTDSAKLMMYSDNTLYYDNPDGSHVFRGTGWATKMTLTATGHLTLVGGLNVGTATGAAAGQVKTSDDIIIADGKNLEWSDANLYRSAADVLKTDDSLTVAGGLNVGTATGAGTGVVKASGPMYSGVDDTTEGMFHAYGGGAGTAVGGGVNLYTAADYDTAISSYSLGTWQDDFIISDPVNGVRFRVNDAGGVTVYQGLNVGTATGATAGQVKTSGGVTIADGQSLGWSDVNLYRSEANLLATDDNLSVAGGILFLASDTALYRAAADVLRTDNTLIVSEGLNVGTATGATAGQVKTSAAILGGGALSLSGQTTTYATQNYIAMADDATANLYVEGGESGFFLITTNGGEQCLGTCNPVSHTVTIISDPGNLFATTDTDGKRCLLVSGGNLTIKNRSGGILLYYVHRLAGG